MRNLVVAFLLSLLPTIVTAQKKRVWIDTDILMGKFAQDVDDGLALMVLFADTNIQIVGISLVGNVDYGETVVRKLVNRYAPDKNIPLYKGAIDSTQFLQKSDAVIALAKALEERPISIFALGPMTNIGTVLELYPDLKQNVECVTFCGGRTPGQALSLEGSKAKFSDYNFDLDPHSLRMVLNTNVPLVLAGFDCSKRLFLSKKDFKHLKKSENKTDRWVYRQLKSWHSLWRTFLGSKNGFVPFDCATVGALLYPEEFEITPSIPAYIMVRENDTKNTVQTKTKPYLEVDVNEVGHVVSYCVETKTEFKNRLLNVLNHPDYQ